MRIKYIILPLFFLLPTVATCQPVDIPNPESMTKRFGESQGEYEARKRRWTPGTPEHREFCKDQYINMGLCKTRHYEVCQLHDAYFRGTCVAPGINKDAVVSAIPALDPEQYYSKRDGVWLTRKQYCEWLTRQPVRRKGLGARQNQIKRSCQPPFRY